MPKTHPITGGGKRKKPIKQFNPVTRITRRFDTGALGAKAGATPWNTPVRGLRWPRKPIKGDVHAKLRNARKKRRR